MSETTSCNPCTEPGAAAAIPVPSMIEHARAKLLRLTHKGSSALSAIQAEQVTWADAVAQGLDPEQLRAAQALLEEILARVTDPPALRG